MTMDQMDSISYCDSRLARLSRVELAAEALSSLARSIEAEDKDVAARATPTRLTRCGSFDSRSTARRPRHRHQQEAAATLQLNTARKIVEPKTKPSSLNEVLASTPALAAAASLVLAGGAVAVKCGDGDMGAGGAEGGASGGAAGRATGGGATVTVGGAAGGGATGGGAAGGGGAGGAPGGGATGGGSPGGGGDAGGGGEGGIDRSS